MVEKPTRAETIFDRITFEPGKMGGRACIRRLRITVGLIVSLIAALIPLVSSGAVAEIR